MHHHAKNWEAAEWDDIAHEFGTGFTSRQVMDRWFYYLRDGISREKFTIEEKRQSLKLSITNFGNWARIASLIGTGNNRSSAQVKSAILAMYCKLGRMSIQLQCPDDVDALPDEFFRKTIPFQELKAIRTKFFETRIKALQEKLEAEQGSGQNARE
jgi:hypothetical protein